MKKTCKLSVPNVPSKYKSKVMEMLDAMEEVLKVMNGVENQMWLVVRYAREFEKESFNLKKCFTDSIYEDDDYNYNEQDDALRLFDETTKDLEDSMYPELFKELNKQEKIKEVFNIVHGQIKKLFDEFNKYEKGVLSKLFCDEDDYEDNKNRSLKKNLLENMYKCTEKFNSVASKGVEQLGDNFNLVKKKFDNLVLFMQGDGLRIFDAGLMVDKCMSLLRHEYKFFHDIGNNLFFLYNDLKNDSIYDPDVIKMRIGELSEFLRNLKSNDTEMKKQIKLLTKTYPSALKIRRLEIVLERAFKLLVGYANKVMNNKKQFVEANRNNPNVLSFMKGCKCYSNFDDVLEDIKRVGDSLELYYLDDYV